MRRLALPLLAAVVLASAVGAYAGEGTVVLPAGAIVFTRGDPHPSLYAMAADGSHVRLLVKNAADAAVSTDGRQIAFVRDRAIWVMGRDGSGQRKLTSPGTSRDGAPAWSADGGAVFFARSIPALDEISSIFSIRSNGTGLRRLTPKEMSCVGAPAASPDGRLVAYTDDSPCDGHAGPDIFAVTTAGRPANLPFVFPETMISQNPAWAPDGRRLAYVASDPERGGSAIYVSSSDRSPPQRVAPAEHAWAPAWSPDGRWITFATGGSLNDIWLVRADGTRRQALTHSSADDGDPAWLPPPR